MGSVRPAGAARVSPAGPSPAGERAPAVRPSRGRASSRPGWPRASHAQPAAPTAQRDTHRRCRRRGGRSGRGRGDHLGGPRARAPVLLGGRVRRAADRGRALLGRGGGGGRGRAARRPPRGPGSP
ncbi:hypothetical protein EFW17_11870 [Halostreptopolyspora alba]|uniref:Uncharacterized protein n=1 Tax=Halostreptopolyspora alba TaxID=2487137 RepID=A0A3N0E9W2_9ACTN|nr:hypothetical protein EFW17_11870 [Nocardiopsaceae bacterium YIM 96095]